MISTPRKCTRCGISEEYEMLAFSAGKLVCQQCDSDIENEWCAETGGTHSLDTFVNAPERDI